MIKIQRLKRKQRNGLILGAALIALLLIWHLMSNSDDKNRQSRIPNVVIAAAKQQDVPVYLSALGTVTPLSSVIVKTQINGRLTKLFFKEGQNVKAGDLLAQIDPRPYQAQLMQYEGQLARDQALLANAKLDVQRYQLLWKQDSISKQILDTQIATVQQTEGIVKMDQGLLENTNVNLSYTRITSPITGRVGLRLVDSGNYIQTSDPNGIAIINTINPITVVFTIPEDNVAQVLKQLHANKILKVIVYDRNQDRQLADGKLLTIDNQIDPATGTVKLKAIFENSHDLLFPSQFVNVKLLVDTIPKAIVVPTAAIQHGTQDNIFVYRLNTDNTVSVVNVETGVSTHDKTVITKGILPNQQLVVEGADKLTDGAKVRVSPPTKELAPGLVKKRIKRRFIT